MIDIDLILDVFKNKEYIDSFTLQENEQLKDILDSDAPWNLAKLSLAFNCEKINIAHFAKVKKKWVLI